MTTKTETLNLTTETLPPCDVPAKLDDFADFAMPLGSEAAITGKKAFNQCPVRKPTREQWVQTHPDLGAWRPMPILELKEDNEVYLVHKSLFDLLIGDPTFVSVQLIPAITDTGVPFLWPVRQPDASGKINEWHLSAARAAELARGKWVRLVANMTLKGYDTYVAEFDRKPAWPEEPPAEWLKIAFEGRMIESADHPAIKRLKGRL